MLPRSLRTLTLLFLLMFLAAILLTGVTTFLATRQTISDLVDQRLNTVADTLIGRAPVRLRAILERTADASHQRDTADLGYILRGSDGRVLFASIAPVRRLPSGLSALDERAGIKGLTFGRALVRDLGAGASLAVIGETEPIDNYNAARANIYLIGFGSVVLIVLGGVSAFGIVIGRRITALNRTADAIVDGDLTRRVPERGTGGEFDRQARTFNRMLDRITELMAEIGSVTSDIAHDLRTPLARLRGRLVALERRADGDELREGLAAATAQCDELLHMYAAMLRIAELEGADRRAGFATVDLSALVEGVVEAMEPVAADTGHRLALGERARTLIAGDPQLLAQALINLVENALRHTPPGSRIEVVSLARPGEALIGVVDNGPGIPREQRNLALRRFGRLDPSREGGGHGLGLPMVQAIARLHRGEVLLADADPGLRVTLVLPLS